LIKDIPCVILAGGKSSRMGEDKALLTFGDFKSLTEYQLDKFSKDFKNVYISCKDKRKFDFDANFIEDDKRYTDSAPYIAILSALEALKQDSVFFISVDVPFFNIEHFYKLYENIEKEDAIVAQSNRNQPLCAIYKKDIIPTLEKLIQEKNYRFSYLFDKISVKFVKFFDEDIFTNLNTQDEYKKTLIRINND
jgi:molybdopterin-guanine dinucleotide biosynthesis protein A